MTDCGFLTYMQNLTFIYYGIVPILSLLSAYILLHREVCSSMWRKSALIIAFWVFIFLFNAVVGYVPAFIQVDQNGLIEFKNYVSNMQHSGLPPTDIAILQAWAECSSKDGKISLYELGSFKKIFEHMQLARLKF